MAAEIVIGAIGLAVSVAGTVYGIVSSESRAADARKAAQKQVDAYNAAAAEAQSNILAQSISDAQTKFADLGSAADTAQSNAPPSGITIAEYIGVGIAGAFALMFGWRLFKKI